MTVPSTRQLLADELVRIRVRAGLTGRDMARALGVSQAQLYRYDKAVTTPSVPKVRQWLDVCREAEPESLDEATRTRIVGLAEQAHVEPRTWTAMRDAGIASTQAVAAEQDAESAEQCCAESVVLPGLLQTPEYAAAAVRRADLHDQFDHSAQLRERLARQAVLFEPGRSWNFVVSERLLTWSPGSPALMPPQRDRLVSLAAADDIEIAVLPDDVQLQPSGLWWVPFTIIRPTAGDRYVVVEDTSGERIIAEPDEVASWNVLWDRLWAAALHGAAAAELIGRAAR